MVNVQKNHYYRKTVIPSTGAAKLSAMYKDTPLNESNTWSVQGGANANRFVVSGAVPTSHTAKQGELDYARLVMTNSGTTLSNSARLPNISLYKLKDNMTMKEGGQGITTNGTRTMVFTHKPAVDNLFIEENFDGADKTLGIAAISDTVGGGLRQLEEPYGDPDALASAIYVGGTFSIFHSGEEIDGGTGIFLKTYFGRNFENREELGETIFIKPVNPSKPSNKWTVKYDNRKGLNKYTVFKPIWRWNDIKGLVSWKKTVSKGGGTDENDVAASTNNTIFGKLGATPDNSSLALSNPDSTPWIFSTVELSQEKAAVGGQSLKLSHIWDSTAGTANSQNLYGPSNKINPQFTMTSITDVPFPIPIDAAYAGGNGATINDVSGSAAMAPELDLKINIAQLGTMLEMKANTGIKFEDPIMTGNTVNGLTSGTQITKSSENYKTLLRSVCITFSNYEPEDKENMDTFISRGLKNFYSTVASGTTDHASTKNLNVVGGIAFIRDTNISSVSSASSGAGADANASNITAFPLLTRYSPYEYAEHNRNRMVIAVSGSGASADTDLGCVAHSTKHVYASGTTTSGATYDRRTTAWNKDTVSTQGYEPTVPVAMDKFFNMKFVWNMNGRNRGNQMVIHGLQVTQGSNMLTGTAAKIALISGAIGVGAKISMREVTEGLQCFDQGTTISDFPSTTTMRVSTNADFNAGSVSSPTSATTSLIMGNTSADLMRCYFTEGVHNENTVIIDSAEIKDTHTQNKNAPPSLPVYFPVAQYHNDPGTGGSGPRQQNCDWSWISFPQYWPRYVTIWVNNYRYIPSSEVKWGKSATSTGIWTSDFPAEEASRDVSVFIDSIKLSNFHPSPEAHHAGANTFSQPINIDTVPVRTFMSSGAAVSGAIGGPMSPNVETGFSTRVNSAGETLTDAHLPTYMCIGFEATGDGFFDTSTAEHKAALMFNGFSTSNFNTMQRNTAFTTHTWASTTSGNSDVAAFDTRLAANERLGYDMFGAYYSSAFVSGTTGSTALPSFLFQGNVIDGAMANLTSGDKTPFGFCLGAGNQGTGSRSFDALTAKGVGELLASTGTATQYSTGLINNWDKRENPLASVKVFANPNTDDNEENIFYVDNADIFREENIGDTEYVLYIAGAQVTAAQIKGTSAKVQNTTAGYNWSGNTTSLAIASADSTERSQPFKLTKAPVFVGNKYAIYADADVSDLLTTSILPWVYVSPIKYWINFEIWPGDNINGDSSIPAVLSGTRGGQKVYDTIIPLSASSSASNMTGSTYNELEFGYNTTAGLDPGRHGLYSKPWILDPGENLETSLDLTQDYGYGAYDPATQEGGVMDVKPAQTGLLTELDFSKIAKTLKPEQPLLTTLSLFQPQANQTATFYGNDYTTNTAYKPYYLFGYHDEVPKVSSFSVGPVVEDILNKNLYELTTENLNAIKFDFNVDGDDIWYKYMIINDSGSIQDKYDQCALWAPLNEPINTDLSQPSFRAYSPDGSFDDSTQTFTNASSKVISDIEGLAGYAAKFNGTDSILTLANSVLSHPSGATEFSIVAHCTPASGMTGKNYVYMKGASSSNGIEIYFSGSTSRNQKVYVEQRGTTLISKSIYPCDGKTPVSIVYTYKNDATIEKRSQLWVNGNLEETAAAGLVQTTDAHSIGKHDSNSSAFDGHIEEFMIYKTKLVPVDKDSEYILNTADYSDKIGNDIASNTAKLFAFDYTNIRGKNDNEVASSKNITWRVDAP